MSKEMKGSYNQNNSATLAFSCCCSDKKLTSQRMKFSTRTYNLCIQERLQIPTHFPASQLPSVRSSYFHSFHIFTTLDSNWEAVNSTAGSGSSSLKRESFEFLLPQPPSTLSKLSATI